MGASLPASRWPFLFCLLGYAILVVLAYLPVGPLDTRQLPTAGGGNPAGSDPYQMVWFLAWVPYALGHGVALFHTNFLDYPTGINLADNTTVPLLGVLGWPITATLGPVATFNFLVRLAFVLSAGSMCFVLRRWCSTWWAPFLGGLLYAFGPYASSQALHLDLMFIPIPPLLLLCMDELVRRQKIRPLRLGLLIGLLRAAQFYISPDILSACLLLMLIAMCGLAIRYRHLIASRWPYIRNAGFLAVSVFVLLAGYPIYRDGARSQSPAGACDPGRCAPRHQGRPPRPDRADLEPADRAELSLAPRRRPGRRQPLRERHVPGPAAARRARLHLAPPPARHRSGHVRRVRRRGLPAVARALPHLRHAAHGYPSPRGRAWAHTAVRQHHPGSIRLVRAVVRLDDPCDRSRTPLGPPAFDMARASRCRIIGSGLGSLRDLGRRRH